ncbi:MAG: transposase family protein [Acidobacteriaceae bacterium]|nr:transposase family protein [Acidobacteriaceae bacterium]
MIVYTPRLVDAHLLPLAGSLAGFMPKLTTELALTALRNAIDSRKPAAGLIHHSDRGVQYASVAYVDTLLQHGIIPSMSRPGNPYDNAKCERFMKTLKQEEIRCSEYRDIEDLRAYLVCSSTATTMPRVCTPRWVTSLRTSLNAKRAQLRQQKSHRHQR